MDSSAKYQKFTQEETTQKTDKLDRANATDSSHIERTSNPRSLLIGLVIAIVVLVAIFFAAAFAIGVGVGVGVSQKADQPQSGVTVITLTPDVLEGEYYRPNPTETGGVRSIRFQSSVNDTHFVLTISTTSNELLITITQPLVLNVTLMGINNTNFLLMKTKTGRPTFVVPDHMIDIMYAVMRGDREMSDEILRELDSESVNQTSHDVLYAFTTSPKALLIIEAALALGEKGYQGTDYASLMQFYQLALRTVRIRYHAASIDNGGSSNVLTRRSTSKTSLNSHQTRSKRFLDSLFGAVSDFVCSDQGTVGCAKLPYTSPYDSSDTCFGLCGYGCCCWEFVCGDCCRHRYCETHDDCCARSGFFTLDCFKVGIDVLFSECSQEYDCSIF